MDKKAVRIHDGIVGALIVFGTVLGFKVDPVCFYIPGLIGVLLIISSFTNFCPVYFLMGVCGLGSCKREPRPNDGGQARTR